MKYFRQLMEEATNGEEGGGMGASTPSWYYSAPVEESEGIEPRDGVAGNGDVPEWFDVSKYKSIEEQAKAYPELSKRFGGFIGAPEEYELNKDYQDMADDPLIQNVMEWGKEKNLSNDAFNELIERYTTLQADMQEKAMQAEMEKLGDKAQERLNNINGWLNTNAPKEIVEIVQKVGTSADAVKALEFFIDKSKGTKVADNNVAPKATLTESEFAEKLLARDKNGNLKTAVDPEYKRYIDDLTKQRMA